MNIGHSLGAIAVGCLLIPGCGATNGLRSAMASTARTAPSVPSPSPTSSPYQRYVASGVRIGVPAHLPPGIVCRMPYIDITAESGGFLFYPGGQLYSDPKGVVTLPGKSPGQPGSVAGFSYNNKNAKWLPVSSDSVAPNGDFYVYADRADESGKIRKVTIADGSSSDVMT